MKPKRKSGFTLIEAVIALAIWMILSVSVLFIWHHASNRTFAVLARQSAFENARGSMDVLITNLQMAKSITLEVCNNYILRELTLPGFDPDGDPHSYVFNFDISLPSTAIRFRRLEFGDNELASNIAMVRIQPIGGRHMNITIETGCEFPIIVEGSVDIRYKNLIIIRGPCACL